MPKKRTASRNVEHRNSRFVSIERWLTSARVLLQERDDKRNNTQEQNSKAGVPDIPNESSSKRLVQLPSVSVCKADIRKAKFSYLRNDVEMGEKKTS